MSNEAQERWLRYLREAEKANLARVGIAEDLHELGIVDRFRNPTVTVPRETLVRLRADYVALTNVVAELLELDPATMTVGDVFFAMVRRHAEKREDGDG